MTSDDAVLTTSRLLLRHWRADDYEPFAEINADPEVMRFLGGPADRPASDALLDRFREQLAQWAYGRWAVELRETGALLGFLGLGRHPAAPEAPEIGWRLGSSYWRQGLATEGALTVRDYAFGSLGLGRIVSVAVPENLASLAVMRRIGMHHSRNVRQDGLDLTVWTLASHEMGTLAGPARPSRS